MSTVDDYLGRVYDLAMLSGAKPSGEAALSQELAAPGNPGMICTGIQKVVQKFLLELLTEQGSQPYRPRRGTSFMIAMRQGRVTTEFELRQAFSAASLMAQLTLRSEEQADDPDEERLTEVRLEGVSLAGGYASLTMRLTTVAGTARRVILPIPTLV